MIGIMSVNTATDWMLKGKILRAQWQIKAIFLGLLNV